MQKGLAQHDCIVVSFIARRKDQCNPAAFGQFP
jgi:hypothetical protein